MEQIRRIMRPTDVPDTGNFYLLKMIDFYFFIFFIKGLLCDLLWYEIDNFLFSYFDENF
jgi:hypothetical protein